MRKLFVVAAAAAALSMMSNVYAGDAAAGKAKAASCEGCHAPSNPANPHLCGQPESYLQSAMLAYKSGVRPNPMMQAMLASINGPDIANVAAYYSAQPCK